MKDNIKYVSVGMYKQLQEENKNLKHEIEQFKKGVKAGTKIIERLEKENKNLNNNLEVVRMHRDGLEKENKMLKGIQLELYKENKKLKEENKKLKFDIEARKELKKTREGKIRLLEECNLNLQEHIDKQQEKIQTLELWLDNKEKLNEEYRKQIDIRKMSRDEKDEDCYGLAKENAELKEKLERIKQAYIGFENSEKDYDKALGELDQAIMNR